MSNSPTLDQIPLFDTGAKKEPTSPSASRKTEKNRSRSRSAPTAAKSSSPRKTSKNAGRGSGQVPEGDVRLTANIREELHLRLKIAAATRRTTIGELIEELVEKHI